MDFGAPSIGLGADAEPIPRMISLMMRTRSSSMEITATMLAGYTVWIYYDLGPSGGLAMASRMLVSACTFFNL